MKKTVPGTFPRQGTESGDARKLFRGPRVKGTAEGKDKGGDEGRRVVQGKPDIGYEPGVENFVANRTPCATGVNGKDTGVTHARAMI